MKLSERLKQKRVEMQLTQDDIAERIHVSRQTISNWENNRTLPDINSLVLISDVYKISLDELIKGDKNMIKKLSKDTKQAELWFVNSNLLHTVLCLFILNLSDSIDIRVKVALIIIQFLFTVFITLNALPFLKGRQENLKELYSEPKLVIDEHIVLLIVSIGAGICTTVLTIYGMV